MSRGLWCWGHSETHCCSRVEGPEPDGRLELQGADDTEEEKKKETLYIVK